MAEQLRVELKRTWRLQLKNSLQVEMLELRDIGETSWPIECSHTTLGTADEELDLSGPHLSYGAFEGATNFTDTDLTGTILTGELKADKVTGLKPPSLPAAPRAPAPCTIEMLKKRPAGDKSWPIACSHTTLGQYFKNFTL